MKERGQFGNKFVHFALAFFFTNLQCCFVTDFSYQSNTVDYSSYISLSSAESAQRVVTVNAHASGEYLNWYANLSV